MKTTLVRGAIAASAAALLGGCGPSVENAFQNCVNIAYKQAIESTKGLLQKDVAQLFEKNARGMAEKQCSIIRDECRGDPRADMCQCLVKQYGR